MPPQIIYEDEAVMVINKPSGMLTHRDGRSNTPSVEEWLGPPSPSSGVVRRGIVHRLDRDTSGLLLIAKTPAAEAELKRQFKNREIDKTYRVVVEGVVRDGKGKIDVPIGRSAKDPRRRVASPRAAGKLRAALTVYRVLERFSNNTYLEAYPKTGRTHQIRAHLRYLNHPVAGDKLYGSISTDTSRQMLHAWSLTFAHPITGRRLTFIAPLPADLATLLAFLRRA